MSPPQVTGLPAHRKYQVPMALRPAKSTVSCTADGQMKYNQEMLDGLTWLLDECQKRGLQLMLCLTNGNPDDYGGMWQYGRCVAVQ